ncbi:hypothetical protein [Parapedobacter sp. 2B3]|uniref:hypothetical protein n=1 Tax=Parapedobacter sp. 2B3 TaxID=3342381 RepID=UPI0035B5E191
MGILTSFTAGLVCTLQQAREITNMVEPKELIDTIITVLQQYDYKFTRKSETELKVHRKGAHGFDIVLETSYRENTPCVF